MIGYRLNALLNLTVWFRTENFGCCMLLGFHGKSDLVWMAGGLKLFWNAFWIWWGLDGFCYMHLKIQASSSILRNLMNEFGADTIQNQSACIFIACKIVLEKHLYTCIHLSAIWFMVWDLYANLPARLIIHDCNFISWRICGTQVMVYDF